MFAAEVGKLKSEKLKPQEQLTLEPYERDHAVVVGVYRYAFESVKFTLVCEGGGGGGDEMLLCAFMQAASREIKEREKKMFPHRPNNIRHM